MTLALETSGLDKQFGGLARTRDLSLQDRARRAPRADRPERRRQDHRDQSADRRAQAQLAAACCSKAATSPTLTVHARVLRGLSRTFQINQLFADLTPLETIGLAVSERLGRGGDWWRRDGHARRRQSPRSPRMLARFHLLDVMNERTATLPYGKQRLLEIALAIASQAARAAARRAGRRRAGERAPRHSGSRRRLPRDVTVLLIEHDMDLVFSFADRISVLVNGALLVEGAPDEVARDPRVQGGLSRRGRRC